MTTFSAPTSDQPISDLIVYPVEAAAFSVSDELDLFQALESEPLDSVGLAARLSISPRAAESVCRVLCNQRLLQIENGRYALSPTARDYLLPKSAYFWRPVIAPLRASSVHGALLGAIRKSNPQLAAAALGDGWTGGAVPDHVAEAFTPMMHSQILAPAVAAAKSGLFAGTRTLLDVGAGSGAFCIALGAELKELKAVAYDLAPVCRIAERNIKQAGLDTRITTKGGNFFQEELPTGHDSVLLSNVLHDWPIPVCEMLLKKVHASLPSGGSVFVHGLMFDDAKAGPAFTAAFDLLMFMSFGGQEFTRNELFELLGRAGFSEPRSTPTFGYYHIIHARK